MKHILKAIPIYHLMALTLNHVGYQGLEKICRKFLWGPGETGQAKIPLVTLATIAQPVCDGGLGL